MQELTACFKGSRKVHIFQIWPVGPSYLESLWVHNHVCSDFSFAFPHSLRLPPCLFLFLSYPFPHSLPLFSSPSLYLTWRCPFESGESLSPIREWTITSHALLFTQRGRGRGAKQGRTTRKIYTFLTLYPCCLLSGWDSRWERERGRERERERGRKNERER